MDTLDGFRTNRAATADRPLLGMTVLVVEDSRYASEAMRLLCLRSGARIRRADSLFNARRHLRVYRPTTVIVDLGLPDGSGADLIAELARAVPRVEIILATSADPGAEALGLSAGADGFIAKPIASMAQFQAALLEHIPRERHPPGPRLINKELVNPDLIAYRDDLAQIADVLLGEEQDDALDYVTQFLSGVARSAGDHPLSDAVDDLAASRMAGAPNRPQLARLAALVKQRLAPTGPL